MKRIVACLGFLLAGVVGIGVPTGEVRAATEVFSVPKVDEIKARITAWLSEQRVTDEQKLQVEVIWTQVDDSTMPDRILDAVVQSISIVDPEVLKLVRDCNNYAAEVVVPRLQVLNEPTRTQFFRANLSLYYGRYLIERRMFDEAWDILKSVDARQVVDPASLFFYQAVAAQGILELKPALDALDQLLTNTERVPMRYSATATLMQSDLKGLQEKSLGEIARLMADSERRLDLGRAGEKVQGVQERIIANFDEIIKKIEQQQNGGGGGGGGAEGGSSNNSGGGADDSQVKGAEAPGDVDKKKFDNKGNWGNLDPKDVAKAKTDLNKNFPSNYEQAIEKYTKKLATRQAKKK